MVDYAADLEARLMSVGDPADQELLVEHLAFAEGRLLAIHPFTDFNGRVTRLWIRELLSRLDFPTVELVPSTGSGIRAYLGALRSADGGDWRPLVAVWKARLGAAFDNS